MTDEEKLQAARELDAAYARAEAFDQARAKEGDDGEQLDAYGHLNWTVGNEDWLACFDAVRVPEGIAYHVVVNCESGGWIDTIEKGVEPVAEAVEKLAGLPYTYADSFFEQDWSDEDSEDMHMPTMEEIDETASRWRKHLEQLAAEPAPEPDEEPSDEYGELRKAALNHRGEP